MNKITYYASMILSAMSIILLLTGFVLYKILNVDESQIFNSVLTLTLFFNLVITIYKLSFK